MTTDKHFSKEIPPQEMDQLEFMAWVKNSNREKLISKKSSLTLKLRTNSLKKKTRH